ncbi:MAG TPA: chromate transporter [Clostridiales bacterium]|nr:chromate transporter [Clostridiales bacterium]
MSILNLFLTYVKIGFMAFGGGYVMLPLIENEFVVKRGVLLEEDVYKLFALAQSMPGILAVNMAIFLGYQLRKTRGALMAAAGIMFPSILIITIIAAFFDHFAELPWVQSIFHGLNIAVLAIIAQALWKIAKTGIKDKVTFALFLFVLAAYLITGLNPVFFTLFGCIAGLLLAGRSKHA